MRRGAVPRLVLGLLLAAFVVGAPGVGAQDRGGSRGGAAQADTLTTEQRLAERLRLLNRAPGVDSANIAADSARLAGARAAGRATNSPMLEGASSDSIMQALLDLPGYEVTQYSGREATWDARTNRLFLVGDSTEVARTLMSDGSRMESDTIDYRQETGDVYFRGGEAVIVPSDGEQLRATIAKFNTETEVGAARDARTRVTEGGEWNIRGDLREISAGQTYGAELEFTSCEEEEPHYHFRAEEYKWTSGGTIVARNVRLYFADVPVFWLPFIAQNTQSGRSSGILAPRFSVNDIVRSSGGYRRRVSNIGYYWAINDYSDATLAFDWFDDNFTALTGSVRYRWLRQFLEGSLDFRQFWRAEGGTETAFNTRHQWQISERTSFRGSARYASSTQFVTNNSFNPAEVTQSIDSEGGFNHRFDWGNLSLSANRRQFLNDDRIEQTLPSANLSLSTVTLLSAPLATAKWYNNLTWSGSASLSRSTSDVANLEAGQYDTGRLQVRANSSINLGNLRVGGSASLQQADVFDFVLDSTTFFPGDVAEQGLAAFDGAAWQRELDRAALAAGDVVDLSRETIDWSTTIDYQQTLIGSTTITPTIRFSGSQIRSDTVPEAQSFVGSPTRVSFGANLNADIYGFFPGFAGFERLRHKITPSLTYDWSPRTEPTALQERVFGARTAQPQNVVALTLNQTFEAKRPSPGTDEAAADSVAAERGAPGSVGADELVAAAEGNAPAEVGGAEDPFETAATPDEDPNAPRRLQQGEIVNLLSLRTSVVRYDFADDDDDPTTTRSFLDGFQTTSLTNQISSDFLRGLSIQMAHDLFEEVPVGSTGRTERRFAPHLSQLNLGFQLSNRSAIFDWLSFGGGEDDPDAPDEDELFDDDETLGPDMLDTDPLGLGGSAETSTLPGDRSIRNRSRASSGIGEWSANLSYALTRPRNGTTSATSSSVRGSLRLQPTEMWEMSWNTSYDFTRNAFNDHTIRLSRDLHRWRANFDFLQTATGNWSFRFEVSLIDNRDLNFDYEQRNNVRQRTNRRR